MVDIDLNRLMTEQAEYILNIIFAHSKNREYIWQAVVEYNNILNKMAIQKAREEF